MPYKRKDGKWIAQVRFEKKRHEKSFLKKKEAAEWERQTLKKLEKQKAEAKSAGVPKPASTSLLDWANEYLEFVEETCQPKTFKEKEATFRRFFLKVPHKKPVTALNEAEVLKFLREEAKKRSGYAANKDRKNLVAGWNWGARFMDPRLPRENPCDIPKLPEVRSPRYIPPEEDFWKVYDSVAGQDQVMLATFLYTAARRGEVFRLKWEDVDFNRSRIRLWTRKREAVFEFNWLPMVSELQKRLAYWLENRPVKETPYVFVCLDQFNFCSEYYGEPFRTRQHLMKRLCEEVKVTPFGFHAIRHLTATTLYHRGYDVAVIQKILRHKSPNTTIEYLEDLGLEETRDALEAGLVERVRKADVTKTVGPEMDLPN